jgi:hypothetical protein
LSGGCKTLDCASDAAVVCSIHLAIMPSNFVEEYTTPFKASTNRCCTYTGRSKDFVVGRYGLAVTFDATLKTPPDQIAALFWPPCSPMWTW